MPYFLQHFAKTWVKALVHGTLHKKLLISGRSTSFGGFSPNAILFATFFQKLGQNPSARYFAQKVAYFEEIDKFWWFFTKCHPFCDIFPKIGSKPQCTVLCTKNCLFRGDRQVLMVYFTKCHTFCNILLKIGSKPQCTVLCTKSCLFRGDRQVLVVFQQMPYFLQHFSKNWVKTLVHGTLHKKLLISGRSTSLGAFSANAILFATFFQKLRSKPQCTVLCTKSCLFRGDRQVLVVFYQMPYFLRHFSKNWVKTLVHGTLHKKLLTSRRSTSFWWFFTKCHTFGNILLKIGSKPQRTVLCTKKCLFRGDRQVLVVFHQMPYFLQHFAKNWVKALVHGTLHKKLLISRRPTSFGGFSPNALLFATFC